MRRRFVEQVSGTKGGLRPRTRTGGVLFRLVSYATQRVKNMSSLALRFPLFTNLSRQRRESLS
jgi:hypothetical protein